MFLFKIGSEGDFMLLGEVGTSLQTIYSLLLSGVLGLLCTPHLSFPGHSADVCYEVTD
jgi:hypothetical protein